jgi:hypothetical protein
MTSSRIAALLLTCSLVGAGAVAAAPPASAAPGWTRVHSDYATPASYPTFQWCEVSETGTKVTLKIRATRPGPRIVSFAVAWYTDSEVPAGNLFGDNWKSDRATVKVAFPRTSTLGISWQDATTGHGFTGLRRTPLGLARCP